MVGTVFPIVLFGTFNRCSWCVNNSRRLALYRRAWLNIPNYFEAATKFMALASIVKSTATSNSVCAKTQPSTQWIRPSRKSSQQACSTKDIVSIWHSVVAARRIRSAAQSLARELSAVPPTCCRYSSPSVFAAPASGYTVMRGDSPDSLERGVTFIRHHSVLAPSAKAGTANAAAPRNRDLRVHLLFTTASP